MATILLEGLFWGSALALCYTYVGYPLLLRLLARGRTLDTEQFTTSAQLPVVSVLMAVHNEEVVIAEKLQSLLTQDYPAEKFHCYIGSDNSSDGTNALVSQWAAQHPHVHFTAFSQRQGKPGVINQLAAQARARHAAGTGHVFIITDASVILSAGVTRALARHFRTPHMAVVDAHMRHTGMNAADISQSEDTYISWEGRLKYHEGVVWRKMVGPFGGCYALRSDYFVEVPDNFLVDDFFITMQAFRRGGLAISEPSAICYEPVGHEIREEFRRKARISAGNIQNMLLFKDLWLPPWGLPNFAFFSHKILRWLGPIWLLLLPICAALLWGNQFYALLFVLLLAAYSLVPLADTLLKRLHLHWALLRHVRYFLMMNLALLAGYFRYLKGIRSNVWQPPKRK